jgi:hypothetical protein
MHSTFNSVLSGCLPTFAPSLPFQLGDRQHHVQGKAAHRGGGVKGVFGRYKRAASIFDPLQGNGGIADRPGEAVELGNHKPIGFPVFDAGKGFFEQRSVSLGLGCFVQLLVPFDDRVTAGRGNTFDALSLHLGRYEGIARPTCDARDTDVAIEPHSGQNIASAHLLRIDHNDPRTGSDQGESV